MILNMETNEEKKEECIPSDKKRLKEINNDQLLYGDFDCDKIPNIDDPYPFHKGNDQQLNEISLQEEISGYNRVLKRSANDLNHFVSKLKENPEINKHYIGYRTKNLPSLLNKLRRKRLSTISDIAGAKILVNNEKEVMELKEEIQSKFDNYIEKTDNKKLKIDDYYAKKHPSGEPYYAIHFDVRYNSTPIELQLKTKRVDKVTEAYHTAYKTCDNVDKKPLYCIKANERFIKLMALARKADVDDVSARKKFDKLKITPKTFID